MKVELDIFELTRLRACIGLTIKEYQIDIMKYDIYLSGGDPKDTKTDWANFDRNYKLAAIERLRKLDNKLKEAK